jgi:hypothetical protein
VPAATTTAQIGANTTNYIPRWNGTQLVSGIIADNGSAATVNGSLSATSLVTFSDGRYKKNVEPLHLSLDKVTQLTGVSYEWKTEEYGGRGFEEGRQIGFIAEDVERVIPELVRTDEMGYKALAYDKLVPVLVEAVKQQQREIGEKDARIEKLERALEKLALQVAAIEGSAKNIAFK